MKTKRPLRCPMNDTEAKEKALTIARIVEEQTKLEAEKKEKNKMFGDLIKEKHARIDALAEDIRTCTEMRQIEIEEVLDFQRNRVDFKRLDTGKVYDHRVMTPKERQTQLDLDRKTEKKKTAAAKKDSGNGQAKK